MTMQALLSRYTYDPLDRLASRTTLAEAMVQRFYKAGQLVTEVQGSPSVCATRRPESLWNSVRFFER